MVSQRFATSDPDEAMAVFSAAFTEGAIRLSDMHSFRYAQEFDSAAPLSTVRQMVRGELDSRSNESDTLFLAWTDRGRASYRVGSRDMPADHGALWSGRKPVDASVAHLDMSTINVDRADFETRARMLLGRDDFALPDFTAIPNADGHGLMRDHFAALRSTYLQPAFVASPLLWQQVTDLTVAVMLAATGLDAVPESSVRVPAHVRRAVEFIDSNLQRPITVLDIAAASGLTARGLQAAFQRAMGETPMSRVRRGRLACAHVDLSREDPARDTVTAIAHRWGFGNVGRFASVYREQFGELPSVTLAR